MKFEPFSDVILFVVFLEMHLTGGYCNNNVFLSRISLFCYFISQAPEKKSRPLSATRKSKPSSDKMDDNTEEIFRAMAEENKSVGEKTM